MTITKILLSVLFFTSCGYSPGLFGGEVYFCSKQIYGFCFEGDLNYPNFDNLKTALQITENRIAEQYDNFVYSDMNKEPYGWIYLSSDFEYVQEQCRGYYGGCYFYLSEDIIIFDDHNLTEYLRCSITSFYLSHEIMHQAGELALGHWFFENTNHSIPGYFSGAGYVKEEDINKDSIEYEIILDLSEYCWNYYND